MCIGSNKAPLYYGSPLYLKQILRTKVHTYTTHRGELFMGLNKLQEDRNSICAIEKENFVHLDWISEPRSIEKTN